MPGDYNIYKRKMPCKSKNCCGGGCNKVEYSQDGRELRRMMEVKGKEITVMRYTLAFDGVTKEPYEKRAIFNDPVTNSRKTIFYSFKDGEYVEQKERTRYTPYNMIDERWRP